MNVVNGFAAKMGSPLRMHIRCLLMAALAIWPWPAVALDLTPRLGSGELEGIKIPLIEITDGTAKVSLQPPVGWQVTGGKTLLRFAPPTRGEIIVELRIHDLKALDQTTPEDLEKWCRKFLPSTCTQVALARESASPFTLRGLPSHEYTYTYAFQAHGFTASIAVIDLSPDQRLSLLVIAYPENFNSTHESAMRTMFSFDWNGRPDGQ